MNPRPAPSTRKLKVDLLPKVVLHYLVADLPGPKDETESARSARFKAQLAEVLSHPRNAAEAMLATHCIMLRQIADDSRKDALRTRAVPAQSTRHARSARQFDKLEAEMQRTLAEFQARKLDPPDPALFAALGLQPYLVPATRQNVDDAEDAFSAVIVPLHPAPKSLQ